MTVVVTVTVVARVGACAFHAVQGATSHAQTAVITEHAIFGQGSAAFQDLNSVCDCRGVSCRGNACTRCMLLALNLPYVPGHSVGTAGRLLHSHVSCVLAGIGHTLHFATSDGLEPLCRYGHNPDTSAEPLLRQALRGVGGGGGECKRGQG